MVGLLSEEEVSELLKDQDDFAEKTVSSKKTGIRPYDFQKPDKFSKDQLRTLAIIFESFSRLVTSSLSAELRTVVNIKLMHIEQKMYHECLNELNNAAIGILDMNPLPGNTVIIVDSSVSFTIIDRLLGGSGDVHILTRELTDVEQAVMINIVNLMLESMKDSFKQILDLNPKFLHLEVNPHFAQVIPPTEMVISITLEVNIGSQTGTLVFCIPYISLESISSKLTTEYWYSSNQVIHQESEESVKSNLANTTLQIKANLAKTKLSLKEVSQLKQDDVVLFSESNIYKPVEVFIGNVKKFEAIPCISNKHFAVKILGVSREED